MDRNSVTFQERIDSLLEAVLANAANRPNGRQIAKGAVYSVAQTHRLFKATLAEPPGAFRRRLVLERAAEMLIAGEETVWQIALKSGFASGEAFARAFRKAYKSSPTQFRSRTSVAWLPSPNRVHYWKGALLRSMVPGERTMNLTQRLVEHDIADTRSLLESALTLTDEQLDQKTTRPEPALFLECAEPTLRARLDHLVFTKEVWLAAVYAKPAPTGERERSPRGMLARWNEVEQQWRTLVQDVEREDRWDEVFIDALCETPETFTFGGTIAHMLDHAARGRADALRAFAALGRADAAFGDPLTWEIKSRA